jgi:hypothetical protein
MAGQEDLGFELLRADDRRVEVVDLEPEKQAVAVRLVERIGERAMVMVSVKRVKLENERVTVHQPLVLGTPVGTLAPQKVLIPSAACFDVAYGNQRLRTHRGLLLRGETIIYWNAIVAGGEDDC